MLLPIENGGVGGTNLLSWALLGEYASGSWKCLQRIIGQFLETDSVTVSNRIQPGVDMCVIDVADTTRWWLLDLHG